MKLYLAMFAVLRVFGWALAIAAVTASANDFSSTWGRFFTHEGMKFYLMSAAFLELLYQHVKLRLSIVETKK